MPADRLLNTVLQYYQDVHDAPRTEQVIGTTTHLLSHLTNPLNLGVLTSQLLTARALWQHPDGLRTSIRIISIYNTAAIRVRNDELARLSGEQPPLPTPPGSTNANSGGGLPSDEWVRAVVKGADDRSQRWQHLLVLTGVLMGMEGSERRSLSRSLRGTLETAVVTAANLALERHARDGPLAGTSIVLALNFVFPLLSEFRRSQINCDALLPLTIASLTGAPEGFRDGQFLAAIGQDVSAVGSVLDWRAGSPSFRALQDMESRPLMGNLGPLAKLAGFAVQNARDTGVVVAAHGALVNLSRNVVGAWQRTALSDADPALDGARLSPETLRATWPVLWQTLRKLLFAVVAVLQAVVTRSLLDPALCADAAAPQTAAASLHILRNLHFVASRDANASFEAYAFVYMASVDAISRFPAASEALLHETRPADAPALRARHVQRTLDLFHLNLAEHLPLTLSTAACDELAIKPALAVLEDDRLLSNNSAGAAEPTPFATQVFESAHSAILSVLSCPQHSALTIRMAPFYIVRLFQSFPRLISPRQFRLAFKTVMQMVSPPFPIAAAEPDMSEAILEMLAAHMAHASPAPLPPAKVAGSADPALMAVQDPMSEQSALALALVDSIPFLPLPLVGEWLDVAARALYDVADLAMRDAVRKRFCEMLVSGELDVDRSAVGVAWWGTRGGRELVLYGSAHPPGVPATPSGPVMSGALGPHDTSRL